MNRAAKFFGMACVIISITVSASVSVAISGAGDTADSGDTGTDDITAEIIDAPSLIIPTMSGYSVSAFMSVAEKTGTGNSPAVVTFTAPSTINPDWDDWIDSIDWGGAVSRHRYVVLTPDGIGSQIGTGHNNKVQFNLFSDVKPVIEHNKYLYSLGTYFAWILSGVGGDIDPETHLKVTYVGSTMAAKFTNAGNTYLVRRVPGAPVAVYVMLEINYVSSFSPSLPCADEDASFDTGAP